jgi:hypothetical protein
MTIEELLGASADSLEAMNDEQLKDYLKDITSLEPKSFGRVLISDDCPIPGSKKTKKRKVSIESEIEAMKKEIEGL